MTTISELGLKYRSEEALQTAGVDTLEDLLKMSQSEVLRIRLIGRKSIMNIEDALFARGLRLRRPSDRRGYGT
jgi:DNA-directed RNA polymerase subunit alpha